MATSGLYGSSPNGAVVAAPSTQTAGLYGSSTEGAAPAAPSSESNGLYGASVNFGGTYFQWIIFQENAAQPATPTGGSWNFTTNTGTPPSGWSNAPVDNPTNPVWISLGIVNSKSNAAIVWSTPGVLNYSGQLNGSGAPTSEIGLDGEFYIQTGVSPCAIWYKDAGTWLQVTGTALYVALTGDQTIGGTKTFSQVIQGSISGNAATATYATSAGTAAEATHAADADTADYATNAGHAITADSATLAGNVTGVVAVVNGGTGATTASDARTNLGAAASGANSDITSMSGITGPISTADYVAFDTGYATTLAAGQLGWDGNNTLGLGMAGGNVVQKIGEDFFYYVKASFAITKGQLCMFTGSVGASGVVTAAPSTGVTNGQYIMGVAAESIANNGFGLIQVFGTLRNVDTSAFADGDVLYYNSAVTGGFTATFPASGPIVTCAAVVKGGSSGGGVLQIRLSVTQRITAGSGITVTQNGSGTTVTNTSPSTGGTVTSVDTAGTVSGLTLTGGPITSSGTITLGGSLDLSSPPAIGGTTPAAGTFTTLTATGQTSLGGAAGSEGLRVTTTASGVNYIQIFGSATGNAAGPTIFAQGSDANVPLSLASKLSAPINFYTSGGYQQFKVNNTASAVNYVQVTGAATGGAPTISMQGSDANVNLNLQSKGTGYLNVLNNRTNYFQFYGGNTGQSPTMYAWGSDTNIDLTLTTKGTGAVKLNTGSGEQFRVRDNGATTTDFPFAVGSSFGRPVLGATTSSGSGNASLALTAWGSGGVLQFMTNNTAQEQMRVAHTASAVNYVQVTGAATTASPTISAQGSDSNIGVSITTKGTYGGTFKNSAGSNIFSWDHSNTSTQNYFGIASSSAGSAPVLSAKGTDTNIDIALTPKGTGGTVVSNNQANYYKLTGAATGLAIQKQALGSDTNISMAIQPKGTGAIDLAAGSSGVNISNGGTVTAITLTNNGGGSGGYTGFPTITISPPTTAGGVQATATVLVMQPITASVQSGGTGYTLNDVVSLVGGTPQTAAATFRVTGVSGGVVTAVTAVNYAPYLVLPTAPVSTTGGTGTGLTLTSLFYAVGGTFTITNAGSGYVEQPTVSFSGGGGSGAAAYATVGSGTVVKSAGSTLSFSTPGGEGFRVSDGGSSLVNYVAAYGSATNPQLIAQGSGTNVSMILSSKGSGSVAFYTGNFGPAQFNVAHTVSAVNYVQVTGAATTASPTISAQGSDANIVLRVASKGTQAVAFSTNYSGSGTGNTQVVVSHTANSVNYLQLTGSAAGSAPVFSSQGNDTNIDLALTPKGTGRVKFGTYTANMALTVQGYIEILDSGGTVRKLAVIA